MENRPLHLARSLLYLGVTTTVVPLCLAANEWVVTNTLPSGPGSLYDALESAAYNYGQTNRITFAIPGSAPFVILPTNQWAALYDDTTLDATTQPGWSNGFPAVVLDGSQMPGASAGLTVLGSRGLIRGLQVCRFNGSGIVISGAGDSAQSNRVEGCWIISNAYNGVENHFSSNNIIGGLAASNRNVLSANSFAGVYLNRGSGHQVAGNWIGVSPTDSAVGLYGQTVGIYLMETRGNVLSGAGSAPQVISGHDQTGIWGQNSDHNIVVGNFIGCDETAFTSVSNRVGGVILFGGISNRIGSLAAGHRNFISGNAGNGVELAGNAQDAVIQGNFIGVTLGGNAALPNGNGVYLWDGVSNSLVAGNLISGNRLGGAILSGSENRFEGNVVGLAINASSVISNASDGVWVGGTGNSVGGTNSGAGNFISGNGRYGVWVGQGPGNVVQGNIIGLDIFGNRRPNLSGVYLSGTRSNLIGGTTTNARNILSGNHYTGVLVEKTASGDRIQGNYIGVGFDGLFRASNTVDGIRLWGGTNIIIGGDVPGAGNVISGNGMYGIYALDDSVGLKIQGNLIGLGADGMTNYWSTNALGRAGATVSGQNTLIGGTDTNARNIIAGNGGYGIILLRATNTVIQGNWIGINGTNVLANGPYTSSRGINLTLGSVLTTIGGLTPEARNVIAGDYDGIFISESASNNIWGNYIGITPSGNIAVTNTQYGVDIQDGFACRVGGTQEGAGNVIYGRQSAVSLVTTNAHHNVIQGNLINLGPAGDILTTNVLIGVILVNAQSNLIGGAGAAARNVIFDSEAGIQFYQSNAIGNVAQGNYIGVGPDGYSPRKLTPQMGTGIDVFRTRAGNTIGGTNAGEGNIIAFHQQGIIVFGSNATRTAIFGNTVYSNIWNGAPFVGIDLAPEGIGANGTTPNDPVPDADTGPNQLQNFPVITNAVSLPGSTRVQGYLASASNARFRIEFFYSDRTNAEGRLYLGATNISTAANGTGVFTAVLSGYAPTSKFITATATDTNGNTSEFCPGDIKPSPATDTDGDGMPDFWESFFGLNPNSATDASTDLDGDGMSNVAEYLAGTAPNNAASYLRMASIRPGAETNLVGFMSSPYRNYDLETGGGITNDTAWRVVITNILGNGLTITVPDRWTPTSLYYRVRSRLP